MKSFFISDNHDTWVGMRLAGIDGVLLHTKEEVLQTLKTATADPKIGIIILTEKIVDLAPDVIMEYKIKNKKPCKKYGNEYEKNNRHNLIFGKAFHRHKNSAPCIILNGLSVNASDGGKRHYYKGYSSKAYKMVDK